MSLSDILPEDSRPIKTDNSFIATFNNPTVNQYDWDVPANKNVFMLELRPYCIYLLDRVNFNLDIDQGAFHQGISTTLNAKVKYGTKQEMVFASPIPFLNYLTNFSIRQFAGGTGNRSETLTLDFDGVLNQVAAMNQAATITAYISWSIYQIKDTKWVKAYQNNRLWNLVNGLLPEVEARIMDS